MRATRQRLPHSLTCRRDVLTSQASLLTTKYNVGPINQPDKPPLEGVTSSWRLNHETALKYTQGRALVLPLKRATQWRITKRLGQMASLAEMPHNQTRIHDGQEWTLQAIPCPKPIRSGVTQWTR